MRDTPSPPTVTTPTQEVEAKQSKEEKTSTSATAASADDKGMIAYVSLSVICDMLFDVCHQCASRVEEKIGDQLFYLRFRKTAWLHGVLLLMLAHPR